MPEIIRIAIKKSGAASFCSHLDTTRTLQRLLRKANVPLWYSEGFHPHPHIVFASPLPLGLEGEKELLDIKLTESAPADIKKQLQKTFPQTLEIVDCYAPKRNFNEIYAAAYRILLQSETDIDQLMNRPLPIAKRTKRGEKMIDVRDYVVQYEITPFADKKAELLVWLQCNAEKNLNPNYLLDALRQYDETLCSKIVTRIGFFDKDMTVFS